MMSKVKQEREHIIQTIINQLKEKTPADKAEFISDFTQQFLGMVALDDLLEHTLPDLYGIVLSLWTFIQHRSPHETKIRIYNPNFETHGWQSTHTIIEILHDSMPFLLDSIVMEINKMGFTSHLSIHLEGLKVLRDEQSHLANLLSGESRTEKILLETPIYIEIDRQTDPVVLDALKKNLETVLGDVRATVQDWEAMRTQVQVAIQQLTVAQSFLSPTDLQEAQAFLQWVADQHFTFLGMQDYALSQDASGEYTLTPLPNTGLGILKKIVAEENPKQFLYMAIEAQQLALSNDQLLIISKLNRQSTVHRPAPMDSIGIKLFNEKGSLIGERRMVGLYTRSAYNTNPKYIPLLRRKVILVMELSQIDINSHAGKVLLNILETLPRDDLFQGSPEELLDICMGIFNLQERRRVRLFARKDIYGRFISCLVYVPRDRFSTELRTAMQEVIAESFTAKDIDFSPQFSDSILARIRFFIRLDPTKPCQYDLKEIEQKLVEVARSWEDDMGRCLIEHFGEELGNEYIRRYAKAFPASYREIMPPRQAVYDIKHMEDLSENHTLGLNIYSPLTDSEKQVNFKLYRIGETIALSDVLPILENMGLRMISEHPYEIKLTPELSIWINDFGMEIPEDISNSIDLIRSKFEEAFSRIWFGDSENDGFNQLVLRAQLHWHEIAILRCYAKHMRQACFTFSQDYIETVLCQNAAITQQLVHLFKLRFDPTTQNKDKNQNEIEAVTQGITNALENVSSLDEDRILRRYLDTIKATLRTNFYQLDSEGNPKPYLAIKLASRQIPDMPEPCPIYEIFISSPRFEAIHLRNGPVARGGLRWSDRPEDFRTEILGLMKAQSVKNAVIVPTGAKGGFVPKRIPIDATREQMMQEAIDCYQSFIRGLLDLTDNLNLEANTVEKPSQVVCYDGDDPYLVVAADKGTATFSDIANAIAADYHFWLGDAFASGGSQGYDHKKIGITARGAWESVKRHFRELDRNIQTQDFTVVGIGDMSGDVFGNGMLLSRHIKLVAAFNHMHIFLDPNPNAEKSFEERKRLFHLPSSTWSDYNPLLISKGGGVFSRKAKSILLSPEIQSTLAIETNHLEPNALIRAILSAPVDLLFNGGIGTFVCASYETAADVGDRASDPIRVKANELRCLVVGEGGNLGFTQRARLEYSAKGGYIYGDFIDNSAGVDCSDNEVNIKILLNAVVANGDMTLKQRDQLLVEMTDEVAHLVLRHNYAQTQAISLANYQAIKHLDLHMRYIRELEQEGKLNRALEGIPDDKVLAQRKLEGKGLFKPSVCVLQAYGKMSLKQAILNSEVPEDPFLSHILEQAFPKPLRQTYQKQMTQHRLRREIIATQLSNHIVNEMGFAFAYRLWDETGTTVSSIVPAYTIARQIFNAESIWEQIEALDNKIHPDTQANMLVHVVRLIRRSTRWLLKNRRFHLDIASNIEIFTPGIIRLKDIMVQSLQGDDLHDHQALVKYYTDAHVPESLAQDIALCKAMLSSLDIVEAANHNELDLENVARVYFTVGERLELAWIRAQVIVHPADNQWDALSREAIRDDLDWQQRLLTMSILSHHPILSDNGLDNIIQWENKNKNLLKRWRTMLEQLRSTTNFTFTMYFVAMRELMDLTQSSLLLTTPSSDTESELSDSARA